MPILKIWKVSETALAKAKPVQYQAENEIASEDGSVSVNLEDSVESLVASIRLTPNNSNLAALNPRALVTTMAVTENNIISIGFSDGNCLLIKNDLTRDRNVKMQLLEVSKDSSITGLAFLQISKSTAPLVNNKMTSRSSNLKTNVFLFVSTRNEICSFDLNGAKIKETKILLGKSYSIRHRLQFCFDRLIWM